MLSHDLFGKDRQNKMQQRTPRPHRSGNANEWDDKGEEDDRSRSVHAGSGLWGAGAKGRREVDTDSGQGTAPLSGKSLAGAYRPGAPARVGALRRRWEPGYAWNHGQAHDVEGANTACLRNKSDASRRSKGA